jgi:hypothetical protein
MRFGKYITSAGLAILLSAPVLAACTPTKPDITLIVDQLRVTVHYSPSRAERPLVVALHGLNSTGEAFAKVTGLSQYADANNFVVAYPDAHLAPPPPPAGTAPAAKPAQTLTSAFGSRTTHVDLQRAQRAQASAKTGARCPLSPHPLAPGTPGSAAVAAPPTTSNICATWSPRWSGAFRSIVAGST